MRNRKKSDASPASQNIRSAADVLTGSRIRECREMQNLSREELAEKIYLLPSNNGKSRSEKHLQYLETGARHASPEYLSLIAEALGVRQKYLQGRDPYRTEEERATAQRRDAERMASEQRQLDMELYKIDLHDDELRRQAFEVYAELFGYKITLRDAPERSDDPCSANRREEIKEYLNSFCTIRYADAEIALSLGDLCLFEIELSEFARLKFEQLFRQKEGAKYG